jgi:hypothetical protein
MHDMAGGPMKRDSRTEADRRTFMKAAGGTTALAAMPSTRGAFLSDPPPKKVRLAVVGGGFGSRFWWHQHPGCEVTAVTDLRSDRRDRLARAYSCKNVFESMAVMLDKAGDTFDAVAVFSGAHDHVDQAVACMKAGKHVLSACPAAVSLEECARLKETKEKTGLKYMMAESSYYRQECIAAREMYARGEFGNLFYSEVEYYHPGIGARKDGLSHFKGKPTWRLGFPPMLYPTHSTGFLVGVTKERLTHVSCLGIKGDPKTFPAPKDTRWNNPFVAEMALAKTDKDNMCRFGVFWNGTAHGERAQWFGEKSTCYMRSSGGQKNAKSIARKGTSDWKVSDFWKTDRLPEAMRHGSGHGGSAVFLSAEFIDALLADREPTVDLYESLAMTTPGIVAQRSRVSRSNRKPGQCRSGRVIGATTSRWKTGQTNMYKASINGAHRSSLLRKARGRMPAFLSSLRHQSCSSMTWHPHPQNQRPSTTVDSSTTAKKIAPALMMPSDTVSIDSDGSTGESVSHPHGMPIHQIRTCRIMAICTATRTPSRNPHRRPQPMALGGFSDITWRGRLVGLLLTATA